MLGLEAKRYFGLDIGTSAIKLVEIRKHREGFRLARARVVDLEIDPASDDADKVSVIVKETLRRVVKEEGIRSGQVAVSVSGQSIFLRSLKIPKVARSKVDQIIQYEAQLQVPFPITEVIWDYEIFELPSSPEMDVALIAVKKEIVEGILKELDGTGLDVDYVDVSSFAMYNIVEFLEELKGKIILDIGGRTSDLIIVEEKKVWSRSILIGGNDLTRAISTAMGIGFKEAEALKRKEGIIVLKETDNSMGPSAGAISDAINPVLVDMLTDVSKSIGYYKSQFGETKVFDELILTGGGAKLRNLTRFMRENIDIPTRTSNLLDKVKEDVDFKVDGDMANRLDVAMGLALRTVTPMSTSINLLPKDILDAKEFEKRKWYIFGALAAGIMIFLTLTGYKLRVNRNSMYRLAKANTIVGRYSKYQKEIAQLQAEITMLQSRLETAADASDRRTQWLEVFEAVTAALPDNVWLDSISKEGGLVSLNGAAKGSFDKINQFKEALNESSLFSDIVIGAADVLEDGADMKGFSITMNIGATRSAEK